MLTPRWRKIVRDLWHNKARTLIVVLSIAVGVFAVGMIVSTQIMLAEDMSSGYLSTNPASAYLYLGQFDDDMVEMVRRMDGVQEAEGRLDWLRVRLKDSLAMNQRAKMALVMTRFSMSPNLTRPWPS